MSHSCSSIMISSLIYCRKGNVPLQSHPDGVIGIKLHYIRLLAGIELVLSDRAPANNPMEHRAHIHHYTDFLHPIFCTSFPSAHSLISLFLVWPFSSLFYYYCLFPFSCLSYFSASALILHPLFLSGKVMHPTFLLRFGIRLKGKPREHCCLSLQLSSQSV